LDSIRKEGHFLVPPSGENQKKGFVASTSFLVVVETVEGGDSLKAKKS
jgi:hypothetical protein